MSQPFCFANLLQIILQLFVVVDTAAGIVKQPITAVDSVIDAINEDEGEE